MSILKKRSFRVLLVVLAVLVVLIGACAIYLCDYYPADAQMLARFETPEGVVREVWEDGSVAFVPQEPTCGFIFYPGGKVEHTAYEPLMQVLAARGVLCVLIEMPFRLAVLDIDAADGVQEKFPQVEHWYIGGHSLGGSMAASYLETNQARFEGLVLLGAYSTADLAQSDLSVLSLYGSEDGVMQRDKYESYMKNLPADFTEIVIEGGNHANFGVYGPQEGDGMPSRTNEGQVMMSGACIAEFIKGERDNAALENAA